MGNNTLPNPLILNAKIDADYLYSLYADDYVCIEDVFATTLQHYDPDAEAIYLALVNHNLTDLKRTVHKMKPVFGFVGMLTAQQTCKEFEDLCQSTSDINDIQPASKHLLAVLEEAKQILDAEYKKIKAFNAAIV